MDGGLSQAACCDIGLQREENQDALGASLTAHGHLFIVADGMGGYAGGAVASRMVVDSILETIAALIEKPAATALKSAIELANHTVWDTAEHNEALMSMGSTVVALLIQEERAIFAHVGDSRLYLLRDGALHQLTKDHTVVQELVDRGELKPEDAEGHPESHILNRALGADMWVAVDMPEAVELRQGDLFLLCSDGLTGMVEDDTILDLLLTHDCHDVAQVLVNEANANGGMDNISVSVVQIDKVPVSLSAT